MRSFLLLTMMASVGVEAPAFLISSGWALCAFSSFLVVSYLHCYLQGMLTSHRAKTTKTYAVRGIVACQGCERTAADKVMHHHKSKLQRTKAFQPTAKRQSRVKDSRTGLFMP